MKEFLPIDPPCSKQERLLARVSPDREGSACSPPRPNGEASAVWAVRMDGPAPLSVSDGASTAVFARDGRQCLAENPRATAIFPAPLGIPVHRALISAACMSTTRGTRMDYPSIAEYLPGIYSGSGQSQRQVRKREEAVVKNCARSQFDPDDRHGGVAVSHPRAQAERDRRADADLAVSGLAAARTGG